MKIKKGEFYKCTRWSGYNFKANSIYKSPQDGFLTSECGKACRWSTINHGGFQKLYTIQDLKDGIVSEDAHHKDPINPSHYKSYSVETIDMMIAIYGKEKTAIHCELTAFKYRQRLGKKDSLEQDLAKEKWYLEKAKELRNDNPVTKL